MIDLTALEAELVAAELDLNEAQFEYDALKAQHREAVANIEAAKPRPNAIDFVDPESWRHAVDNRRFALSRAISMRKDVEAQHAIASRRLASARSMRDALAAKVNLAQAASAAERRQCDLTRLQQARDAYFAAAPEFRPFDGGLMALVSSAQVHAFLSLLPTVRAQAEAPNVTPVD